MSIFNFCPFNSGYISEDSIKIQIIDFFKSTYYIIDYNFSIENQAFEDNKNVKASELVDYFFIKNKIPLTFELIDNVNIYELIEIFLNIYNNYEHLLKEYNSDARLDKDIPHTSLTIRKINNNLYGFVFSFLKYKNIKIKNTKNKYILDFTSPIIVDKTAFQIKVAINSYLKIMNNITEKSLADKCIVISGLKNYLDSFFENKGVFNENKFMTVHTNELASYWQSLWSHLDKKPKNEEHKRIKDEWNDKMSLEEKHKLSDQVFDCIIFINYKRNTK